MSDNNDKKNLLAMILALVVMIIVGAIISKFIK